jgi:hypothetical protein
VNRGRKPELWQPSGLVAVLWQQILDAMPADGSAFRLPRLKGRYSPKMPAHALASLVKYGRVDIVSRTTRVTMIKVDPKHRAAPAGSTRPGKVPEMHELIVQLARRLAAADHRLRVLALTSLDAEIRRFREAA